MNISATFIQRPVATTLLTIGVTLVGAVAFRFLPVAALPQVEFPTINVSANLPGASPETMATSVAAPLERQFTRIAGVTEMTSNSTLGATSVTLQFELSRDIDGAARDVQAAINAARADLPAILPSSPKYRKVNPADAPVLILAVTSEIVGRGRDVRRRVEHSAAEALTGRRGGAGERGRRLAPGCPRRSESHRAEQVRDRAGRRPPDAEQHQREPAERSAGGRDSHLGDQDQ